MGNATPVATEYAQYPYISDLVTALYEGGVVESDPVRAASLSQQHLVTKQIHSVNDQAKLGTSTKRRREEVEYTHQLAKKIKTEGRYFMTKVNRVVEAGEFTSPVHTDISYSQSSTKFGFRTLVADLGQGAHTHVHSEKLMFTSTYDAKRFCTSCKVPHSIWDSEEVNIILSDQHIPATIPNYEGKCFIQLVYGNATLDTLRRYMFLPIEIDKGANNCSDRNGAVDILQEAVLLERKINLFLVSGTSCLLSGPTGYIHSM